MRNVFYILLLLLMLPLAAASAQSSSNRDNTLYGFGYATVFADSVIYLTEIHELPSATLNSRTGFLHNRAEYSKQLKAYLEQQGISHPVCAIFFDKDKNKLTKKLNKIVDKTIKAKKFRMKSVLRDDFSFKEAVGD